MLWQGFLLVLTGAFLMALFQVLNKKLLTKDAPADCISTINFLGSGVILLVIALIFSPPKIQSWFSWPNGLFWPLITTALLNIIIGFGNTRALKYGDASLIQPISAAQPMIVLIPSMLILGEYPGWLGYIGLALLALGTYIFSFTEAVLIIDPITKEKAPWQPPASLRRLGRWAAYVAPVQMLFKNKGVKIAFVAACCGAVAINFDKLAVLRSSALFAPALVLLFLGLFGLIKVLRTGEWRKLSAQHRKLLIINPVIFVIVMICFWTSFYFGLAAYVGSLKRFNVVFVLFLSFFLLGEIKAKNRWPGAVVMAIGAALLVL